MNIYTDLLSRAMDEHHYAHYTLHQALWDESLYDFLRSEYRRVFEDLALAHPGRPIVLHYVGPGLNHPCLTQPTWEPIADQIRTVHLHDIDERVLAVVSGVVPEVLPRCDRSRVRTHRTDISSGMGQALVEWTGSVRAGVARVAVPEAGYFDAWIERRRPRTESHPTSDPEAITLVVSELAVSSTGLNVFWDLYQDAAFRTLGITPAFVNALEQVYNTCVARSHLNWVAHQTGGQGVAVVAADVERIYTGDEPRRAPSFAVSLASLLRANGLQVKSAPQAIWRDIPSDSTAGVPPHVHRVVCCTAADGRRVRQPCESRAAGYVGVASHGC